VGKSASENGKWRMGRWGGSGILPEPH
jgi:hypothetical protein